MQHLNYSRNLSLQHLQWISAACVAGWTSRWLILTSHALLIRTSDNVWNGWGKPRLKQTEPLQQRWLKTYHNTSDTSEANIWLVAGAIGLSKLSIITFCGVMIITTFYNLSSYPKWSYVIIKQQLTWVFSCTVLIQQCCTLHIMYIICRYYAII